MDTYLIGVGALMILVGTLMTFVPSGRIDEDVGDPSGFYREARRRVRHDRVIVGPLMLVLGVAVGVIGLVAR